MLKEKRMNKEKLDNGLRVKVYKLTNNKNGLEYRVIVREKRIGKIIHDKMFFTKEGVEKFIKDLRSNLQANKFNKKHAETMLQLKNAKDDKERDIIMEQNYYPVYTGGCEGLRIKHKTNGIKVINYDFLDKIRYDEKEMPEQGDANCVEYASIRHDYIKEYGLATYEVITIAKEGFNNINYKDTDNAIVRFKHKLYRH